MTGGVFGAAVQYFLPVGAEVTSTGDDVGTGTGASVGEGVAGVPVGNGVGTGCGAEVGAAVTGDVVGEEDWTMTAAVPRVGDDVGWPVGRAVG